MHDKNDVYAILRNGEPVLPHTPYFNEDLVKTERSYVLTVASVLSVLFPDDTIQVRNQHYEIHWISSGYPD